MHIAPFAMLCACGAAVLAGLAGCGEDGLPSDAAAKVGDTTISISAVERAARGLGTTDQPAVNRDAEALGGLIEAQWLKREAEARNLSGGGAAARQRLLTRIKITKADLRAYYAAHRSEYGPPRRRVVFFMKVRTLAEAQRAREGLAAGRSWTDTFDIARKNDPTVSADALPFIEHQFKDKAFGEAMFAAPLDTVTGPLRTRYGIYLFGVSGEDAWAPDPPAQYRAAIAAQARPWKLEQQLQQRYADETECADRYQAPAVPECA